MYNFFKGFIFAALFCLGSQALFGQALSSGMHAKWEASADKIDVHTHRLNIKVQLDEHWGIYSSKPKTNDGPLPLSITYENASALDSLLEDGLNILNYTDFAFKVDVTKFLDEATFQQTIQCEENTVNVVIKYMLCDDRRCTPPQLVRLKIPLK